MGLQFPSKMFLILLLKQSWKTIFKFIPTLTILVTCATRLRNGGINIHQLKNIKRQKKIKNLRELSQISRCNAIHLKTKSVKRANINKCFSNLKMKKNLFQIKLNSPICYTYFPFIKLNVSSYK